MHMQLLHMYMHVDMQCNIDNCNLTTSHVIPVAQWIRARWTSNSKVVGSSPIGDDFVLSQIFKS